MSDIDFSGIFTPMEFGDPFDSFDGEGIHCDIYLLAGKNDKEAIAICTFDQNVGKEEGIKKMEEKGFFYQIYKKCLEKGCNPPSMRYVCR